MPPANRLVFNEVMTLPPNPGDPNPVLGEPWIELFNPGATFDASGWKITVAGNPPLPSDVLPLGSTIPGHGYFIHYVDDLHTSPLISLFDPSGKLEDSAKPPLLQPSQTYARVPDGSAWQISNVPTPGSPNALTPPGAGSAADGAEATVAAIQTELAQPLPTFPPDLLGTAAAGEDEASLDAFELERGLRPTKPRRGEEFRPLSITAVRGLADGSAVITAGIVTLPPGRFETARGYLQADGAGILIHVGPRSMAIALGQSVSIKGRVHHYHGEVEVAAVGGGLQVAGDGTEPSPAPETFSGVGPDTEALLVQVSGPVVGREREYVMVGDAQGNARIYLYSRLGLRSSQFTVGQAVTATGVVNRFGASQASYRLLPRDAGDLTGAILSAGTPLSEAEANADSRQVESGRPWRAADSQETLSPMSALTGTPFITPVAAAPEPLGTMPPSLSAAVMGPAATVTPSSTGPVGAGARILWLIGGSAIAALVLTGTAFYLRRR